MPNSFVFANFMVGELLEPITVSTTEIEVSPSVAAKLQLFTQANLLEARLVLWDGQSAPEIVGCISNPQTGVLTVTRAQENTTAVAWPAGTQVRAAMTAGILSTLIAANVDPISVLAGYYLPLSGGTLTGALVLPNADPTLTNHATRKSYVDGLIGALLALAGGTMAGNINMNSNRILNLLTPLTSGEPATKGYVDILLAVLASQQGTITTTGTGTAYVAVTPASIYTPIVDGDQITLTLNATNGTAPNLSVDGTNAPIVLVHDDTPPKAGTLLKNGVYRFTYRIAGGDLAAASWVLETGATGLTVPRAVTGGSSTAYTLTTGYSYPALDDGAIIRGILHTACGAAPTLAVDGGTAYNLVIASGVAVKALALPSFMVFDAIFRAATSELIILNMTLPGVQDIRDVVITSLAAGQGLFWNGTSWVNSSNSPRGYIDGMILSNDGVTPNTIIDVAAGTCRSDDNTVDITLAAFTKTTGGTFVAGSGAAGKDTAFSLVSAWIHIFAIYNPSTAVSDVLLSNSATAPTLPSGYTKKRYIGSILTNGSSNIVTFRQKQDYFEWITPGLDYSQASPGTGTLTITANTPSGVAVRAVVNALTLASGFYIFPTFGTVSAPSTSAAPLASAEDGGSSNDNGGQMEVEVDTSQQFFAKIASNAYFRVSTLGYFNPRGKNA